MTSWVIGLSCNKRRAIDITHNKKTNINDSVNAMTKPDRNYRNPPIQEAICEIHYELSEQLAFGRIELFKPICSANYPYQKTVQEKRVDFHLSPEGLQTKEGNLGHRLICKSADGKRLVQLSGLFVVINQLSPYPGWEEMFRDT